VRKRNSNQKIGLFGNFGSGNFGNDGSLEAMIRFLRAARPNAELVCICRQPEPVQKQYQLSTLPLHWRRSGGDQFNLPYRLYLKVVGKLIELIQVFKQLRNLDVLIVPGTGILDDFGERPGGMPYALLRTFLAAKFCGAKILLVSIGAGPIRHPINRWLMTTAVRLADYRSYRDPISKTFMSNVGIDTRRDPIYPDLAFKLPETQTSGSRRAGNDALAVGIGVMTYRGWRYGDELGPEIYSTYLRKLAQFVIWLLDRGDRVRILMGDTEDRRAANELLLTLARERAELAKTIVAEPACSLHDVMRQIAEVDVLVATRFHNVVCSLIMVKPLISVGYADKNDALMADMGMSEYCQHIERLNVDLLIRQYTRLVANRAEHEAKIRETRNTYRERLDLQEALILSKFL
jgi:polysaccharide pyruvyl transferase WcaK-like protein